MRRVDWRKRLAQVARPLSPENFTLALALVPSPVTVAF
jgi:hypothetical protein